jgi:hypothetical protein
MNDTPLPLTVWATMNSAPLGWPRPDHLVHLVTIDRDDRRSRGLPRGHQRLGIEDLGNEVV